MSKSVIITAAGSGSRMKSDIPKQFLQLAGRPILFYTIEKFYEFDNSIEIILVLPESQIEYWKGLVRDYRFKISHQIVIGGHTRFDSIKKGLEKITGEYICVHDGVRPFVSKDVIERVYDELKIYEAVIPVLPLKESIRKQVGNYSKSVNRANYFSVQTPQGFHRAVLKLAYNQKYNSQFTDDASVVEKSGVKIKMIQGNEENIKITTPFDLKLAEFLL